MKCPHCGKEKKALVVESRPHDGEVFRRRMCGACGRTFVTQEQVRPGMQLPRPSGPARAKLKYGQTKVAPIRATGEHLDGLWKR